MKNIQTLFIKFIVGSLILMLGTASAFAAALSNLSDTMSSAKIGANSDHTFVFTTPSGIAAGSSTVIVFPSEFIIPASLTFADVDVNIGGPTTASATLAAAPSGATWGVVRTSTSTLTLTNGTSPVSAATTVYIRVGLNAIFGATGANQVINATTTGNKAIGISGNMWDYGTTTVNMITNDTVSVNAVVPQALTFSISSNAINFGNLTSSNPKYASSTNALGDTADTVAHTLQVSTNAASGYTITVQGSTLTSQQNPLNTITAIGASPATSALGTEQFGIYATKAGGTNGTIATPYATVSSFGYNASSTAAATFASGSSATAPETYSLHYIANIAAVTEAGTYSANLIYVGTSNF